MQQCLIYAKPINIDSLIKLHALVGHRNAVLLSPVPKFGLTSFSFCHNFSMLELNNLLAVNMYKNGAAGRN